MKNLFETHNLIVSSANFLFRREIIDKIDWTERLIGLIGSRGVGKTTALIQYINESKITDNTLLYVSLDNLALPYTSLYELANDFQKQGGKRLIIDEVHKFPNWAKELKNIYDMFPNLKVVFSGSSILKILTGNTDLSRRAVFYKMSGLSFREFLQIKTGHTFNKIKLEDLVVNHVKLCNEILSKVKPLAFFKEYLLCGYYPFFLQSTNTYHNKLQAIVSYIIEYEMYLLSKIDIRNTLKIRRLLQNIAGGLPYITNIKKMAESVELDRVTLLSYIDLLDKTDLITNVYQQGSFYSKLTKPSKILLSNTNLYYAITTNIVNIGSIRESFFVSQLKPIYNIQTAKQADFNVNDTYIFEVGGKNKTQAQIKNLKNAYLVQDNIEFGYKNEIPLWLFGFLY